MAFVAVGVTVVLWASAFVGIRAVATSFGPGPLTLGRLLVGCTALGVVVAVKRGPWPARRDLLFIIGYGVLWFAGYNLALNAAEQHLDAGTTALLVNIGPILIAILAGIFLHEGFPRPLLIGSAVALVGAALVAFGSTADRTTDVNGAFLAVLAAVFYAAGVTVQKPVLKRVNALQATFLGCSVGAIVTLPFAPALWTAVSEAPTSAVLGLVYLGVFPTAIAFTTWAYALSRMPAGRLGATTYLTPIIATLLAWAFLGEVPAALAFVGGSICLVGVAITRMRRRIPAAMPRLGDVRLGDVAAPEQNG
ncbi:DMT family transporter [Nakamurella antarctica]|uniref:DMT family transporter n=2 Tax=Nakamurella antarctica TaxID=1902245 RepID=A0A3G8ZQR7_9ACTN|nr:DMT family transporter [Nakamurella antarctica]